MITRTDPDVPPQNSEPHPCPLCGHTLRPFDAKLSALLDTVALLMAVVTDLKAGLEEVAL